MAIAFAALVIVEGLYLVLWYVPGRRAEARRRWHVTLTVVASHGTSQIKAWVGERAADAKTAVWHLQNGAPPQSTLERYVADYAYESAYLIDGQGRPIAQAGKPRPLNPCFVEMARKARDEPWSDFCLTPDGSPRIVTALAMRRDGQTPDAPAALLFVSDPYRYIYPVLDTWTDAATAEAAVARVEGDYGVSLSPPRNSNLPPMTLRRPLARTILGVPGALKIPNAMLNYRDYRNVPVFGQVLRIGGTPWVGLVKVDQSEVFHEANQETMRMSAALVLPTGLLAWAAVMILRSRRVRAMRAAEGDLRSSELRFSALSEHSPLGVYVIEDGRYVYVNDAAATILGVSRKELLGATPELWVHPQDLPIVAAQLRLGLDGTVSSMMYECRAIRKDGTMRYLRIFGGPVTIDGSRVLIGNIVDITQQRNAEEALRQSEQRYRTIVETSIVGISSVDEEYRFTYLNRTMAEMLGYDPGELLGRSPIELIPPEDLPLYHSRVAERKQGTSGVFQHRMMHKDGSIRDVLVSAVPIVDAEGKFRGSFAIFFDVTEHHATTRQVQRLAAVMEQLTETILITDAHGTIVHVNPAFERMTGYTATDAVGHHWSVRRSPHVDPTVFYEMWRTVVRGGTWEGDLKTARKDGTVFEARATITPVRNELGTIINYVMVARDVTGERAAEASLHDAHTQLRALSRRLVEMQEAERKHIARELHDEVGQSLTATRLQLQSMQSKVREPALAAQLAQCVELIDTSLAQLRSLTRGLRPPLLDELGLIAALRALTTQTSRLTGMTVHFGQSGVDRRLPEEIEIACYRIAQESITNIVKHAHATEVSVDLARTDGRLTLRVRDDGVGFDVAAARKRAVSGLSMGLTGMAERVAFLGGTIHWRTVPEGGTEVVAEIPLERSATA